MSDLFVEQGDDEQLSENLSRIEERLVELERSIPIVRAQIVEIKKLLLMLSEELQEEKNNE